MIYSKNDREVEVVYDDMNNLIALKSKLISDTDLTSGISYYSLKELVAITDVGRTLSPAHKLFHKLTSNHFHKMIAALDFDEVHNIEPLVLHLTLDEFLLFQKVCAINASNREMQSTPENLLFVTRVPLSLKDRIIVLRKRRQDLVREYRNLAIFMAVCGALSAIGVHFSHIQMSGVFLLTTVVPFIFSAVFLTYSMLFGRTHIKDFIRGHERVSTSQLI